MAFQLKERATVYENCSYIIIDHCVGGWWSKCDMKGMMSMRTRNDINTSPQRAGAINLNLALRHLNGEFDSCSDAPLCFQCSVDLLSSSTSYYCRGWVHTSIFLPLSERERNDPRTISTLQIFLVLFRLRPGSLLISLFQPHSLSKATEAILCETSFKLRQMAHPPGRLPCQQSYFPHASCSCSPSFEAQATDASPQ